MTDPVFARNPREAERLSEKHLAIVGCGSGGSALADMAARAGIGKLTLIDPEKFAAENVSRHLLDRTDLDKPKVEAVREKVLAVNPLCRVEARHAPFDPDLFYRYPLPREEFDVCGRGVTLFGPCRYVGIKKTPPANPNGSPDVIASCVDSFACESLINGYSLREGIPAVYGGCWGEASVGEILYVVPGKSPCYECFAGFRRGTAEIPADPRKYTDPDFDSTKIPGQVGLWANILVVTGLLFQVVLGLLDPESSRCRLIDYEHTLFLVNVSAFDSGLQPLAVTLGKVKKGCAVCDEYKLADLGRDLIVGCNIGDSVRPAQPSPEVPALGGQ